MIKSAKEMRDYALEHLSGNVIPIYGEINGDMTEIVIDCIHQATKEGIKKIELHIDSDGGWTESYAAITAKMKSSGIEFTGIVFGKAMSSGLMLLLDCKHRLAYPDSKILFHWGGSSLSNSEFAALMDGHDPMDYHRKRLARIVNTVSEQTGISVEELKYLARYDQKLSADQALEYGFIDEVIRDKAKKTKTSK